jgi:hypothetical protein
MANSFDSDFWEPVGRASRRNRPETYPRGDQEQTRAGGVILAFVASLSTILVIAGLAYAVGMSTRHKAALAADDCEPSLAQTGLPCINQRMELRQYQAIVAPAASQLNADTAAYDASERRNLAAAETALTAEVATEQSLDQKLTAVMYTPQNKAASINLITNATSFGQPVPSAAIIFTPPATVIVQAMIRADQTLIDLTGEQARSSSLGQLRSFNARVQAATVAVQSQLRLIRAALAAQPSASEEPCAPCL